jgi:hypothetical protein
MRLGSRGCHEQRSPGRGCRTRLVRALIDAALIRLGREAAGKESPTAGEDGGNGKLGICVSCRGVGDRAITDDPVCFGHTSLLFRGWQHARLV